MATTRGWKQMVEAGAPVTIEMDGGRRQGTYPAADTVEEVIGFAMATGQVRAGERVTVYRHLPGSKVGAQILQEVWAGVAR